MKAQELGANPAEILVTEAARAACAVEAARRALTQPGAPEVIAKACMLAHMARQAKMTAHLAPDADAGGGLFVMRLGNGLITVDDFISGRRFFRLMTASEFEDYARQAEKVLAALGYKYPIHEMSEGK